MKKKSPLYIIGDLHGDFYWLEMILEDMPRNSTIVQIGDFGLGFSRKSVDEKAINMFDKLLSERGQKLFVIRGNHDNKHFFQGQYISNIELLPDYSVREINGKKCLFVGGAISIDRCDRVEGVDYWQNEGVELSLDKVEKSDILFSHTCGTRFYPQTISSLVEYWQEIENKKTYSREKKLLKELADEKLKIDQIINKSKPNKLFYGHFHSSHREVVDGIDARLLGIQEVLEITDV